MSNKKYVKPKVEVIKFNNGDENMTAYLLSAANHTMSNMSNGNSGKNSITLHS